MAVVLTGGAGYIGTHCCVTLIESGFDVIVLDNFCNSTDKGLQKVKEITGKSVEVHEIDIRNYEAVKKFFQENKSRLFCVLHCAALKAVGESVRMPIMYYQNNIAGSLNLFQVMSEEGVKRVVFSSSATVYGDPEKLPILETFPVQPTNPYGRTKLYIEEILRDIAKSDSEWQVVNLRYFNPVGAHPSGKIGEDPNGVPNNLMPYVAKVAVGKLSHLTVYGTDYKTPDGTGVRDYIHIMDLAGGHVAAIQALKEGRIKSEVVVNLGTGKGNSVLEMLKAMEKACGKTLKHEVGPRREGDVSMLYADVTKARELLGWEAKRSLEDMCADLWRWQEGNPDGYGK
mmetsp:Transcript_21787/g.51737  ORF Transcript_21787/g.51737 Transcript_21787/m.51737 type:complete len:342 (+) Transcript_21787:81-1106(+)